MGVLTQRIPIVENTELEESEVDEAEDSDTMEVDTETYETLQDDLSEATELLEEVVSLMSFMADEDTYPVMTDDGRDKLEELVSAIAQFLDQWEVAPSEV